MLIGVRPEAAAGEPRVAVAFETSRRRNPRSRPFEVPSGAGADP